MPSDLLALSEPFPTKYVHANPSGGGSYVKHSTITQRLLYVLGPHSFELVEIVRGDVAGRLADPSGKSARARAGSAPLSGVVVAVIARLRVVVDGREVVVEEAGDCEEPHNWTTDGQRLKDAMSDAYKRCAMRLGCGLHLWAQDEYFLDGLLSSKDRASPLQGPQSQGSETARAQGGEQTRDSAADQEPPMQPAQPDPEVTVLPDAAGQEADGEPGAHAGSGASRLPADASEPSRSTESDRQSPFDLSLLGPPSDEGWATAQTAVRVRSRLGVVTKYNEAHGTHKTVQDMTKGELSEWIASILIGRAS